ncbi:MAG: tetraacyldisaccharide 4'-kinase [Nitrospinae bacterium]|nr:tetraacyldisaccharide 4'-kinase [Nitrospinota bacterium]
MRFEALFHRIVSKDRKVHHVPVFLFLRAVSFFYGWAQTLRAWCYRAGIFRARRLDCRTIGVGNLTLGGTGKTPMVLWIADALRRSGRKPAILGRGYGGASSAGVRVVSDGERIVSPWATAGDEPVMMAMRLPGVPVLTGRDRYRTGRHAIRHLGADTLILDDGYQRLDLLRDLNILLCDQREPFGNGLTFPAGHLREPASAARRADLICLTRCAGRTAPPEVVRAAREDCPVFFTALRLDSLLRLDDGREADVGTLRGRPAGAFCGIAGPESFRKSLEELGVRLTLFRAFPDHHPYAPEDLKSLEEDARRTGAEFILTTDKDAVKLDKKAFALTALVARVKLEILDGEEDFLRRLLGEAGRK